MASARWAVEWTLAGGVGVVPLEVLLGAGLAGGLEFGLGFVIEIEVGGADSERVDVHGAMPVAALQMAAVLRPHQRPDECPAVVEKVVDRLALGRCAVAEQRDLLAAVEPEAKRLPVVNERAGVAAPFAVGPGVVRWLGGVALAVALGHIFSRSNSRIG